MAVIDLLQTANAKSDTSKRTQLAQLLTSRQNGLKIRHGLVKNFLKSFASRLLFNINSINHLTYQSTQLE